MYQYTNWYQSNVDTEVDAEVVMSDNSISYYYLGTVLANANWTKFSTTFTPPAGAKSLAIYQILAKVGYITSDDYSLNTYVPAPLNRALVSVTFDDGWTNQFQNARPLLLSNHIPATFYIISGELTDQPDYMSAAQVKTLQTDGNEIASHSVTHPDLTTLSQASLVQEMSQSQAALQSAMGVPITDFAYPFGAYNANTIAVGKQYYKSQRTVNAGYNTKDSFDLTQLKIYEVDSNISQAQVQGWINGAIAQKSWLILVYHEIANTPTDPSDSLYTVKPSDLSAELAYLKSTNVATVTVNQAINEILPQL
jgi:peptidoglycan/xylan/chitin deacetylase (PgdA/CDA1 family)